MKTSDHFRSLNNPVPIASLSGCIKPLDVVEYIVIKEIRWARNSIIQDFPICAAAASSSIVLFDG